jgi:hypothetical protein
MNLYLFSLLIFAIPANVIAGLTIWRGRRMGLKWNMIEYLLIYMTWGMNILLIQFVFNGLENALVELEIGRTFLGWMMFGAGVLGGMSLMPRFYFKNHPEYAVLITSVSSFMFAVIYAKFGLLFFFLAN